MDFLRMGGENFSQMRFCSNALVIGERQPLASTDFDSCKCLGSMWCCHLTRLCYIQYVAMVIWCRTNDFLMLALF